LGIDRASPLRARAAVRFVLQELSGEGHVGYPESGVVERTAALTQISPEVVGEAIEHERTAGEVVREPQAPLFSPSPLAGEGRGGGEGGGGGKGARGGLPVPTPHPHPPPQGGRGPEAPQGGRGQAPDEPWLYLKPLFLAEVGVARALRNLCEGGHPLPQIDAE